MLRRFSARLLPRLLASTAVVVALLLSSIANAAEAPQYPAEAFAPGEVKLLPGPYEHQVQQDSRFLLGIEPDRLLSWYRQNAGLEPKGEVYGGWESEGIAGHCLGHYLSACARMSKQTGNEEFRKRVAAAQPLSAFLLGELSRQVNLSTPDGRARLVSLARPHLARLREGPLHTLIVDELARLTRLTRADIESGRPAEGPGPERAVLHAIAARPVLRALQLLLEQPDLAAKVVNLEQLATAEARLDMREFAVAMGGLVEVHEVHVDLGPRQVAVELRVEMDHGLAQVGQAANPHLGRREGVHPGDDPDTRFGRVGLGQHPGDLVRGRHHALGHDPDRDVGGFVKAHGDLPGIVLDRAQDVRTVQVLAARGKPYLHVF